MNIASVTSPFVNAGETPWIVWNSKDRVSALPIQKQNHESVTSTAYAEPTELPAVLPAPKIKRMQYNTVMNRIAQASKNTGSYSAWTP